MAKAGLSVFLKQCGLCGPELDLNTSSNARTVQLPKT